MNVTIKRIETYEIARDELIADIKDKCHAGDQRPDLANFDITNENVIYHQFIDLATAAQKLVRDKVGAGPSVRPGVLMTHPVNKQQYYMVEVVRWEDEQK